MARSRWSICLLICTFVEGTPDGWLMQRGNGTLYQFRWVDDEIVSTELAMPEGEVTILDAPLLGAADLEPVTPILK